jgi:hypothetical protein
MREHLGVDVDALDDDDNITPDSVHVEETRPCGSEREQHYGQNEDIVQNDIPSIDVVKNGNDPSFTFKAVTHYHEVSQLTIV